MTNTIITGASGFIGSHLASRFGSNASWLKHDDILQGHTYNAERLFFLSTYGNMAHHTDHRMIVKANIADLITVLNGFDGWLCFMSSSSVMLPVQTPYSISKRSAEQLIQTLPEIRSCIVRPYSVTGVGEQKEHLIPTLIRSCMEGEPMTFNPFPVHDFVDVEDVVDGLISLAEQEFTGTIEFGNGRPVTNQEVREIVEAACGKPANAKSVTDQLRPYDNSSWYCRKRHPLWNPKKSLRDSIHGMVEAYKSEHS